LNWYKQVLADRGTPRAFDLEERIRDPYKSSPKVDPAGYHQLGGKERTGYPRGTQAVDEEEDPHNIRNLEDSENLMLIDPEPGIGQGAGYNKMEPFTDPVDKLNRMNETPDPTGPHNMPSPLPSAPNRLTDKDVYDWVSKKSPSSRIRNI
jgi:hypothetical protein